MFRDRAPKGSRRAVRSARALRRSLSLPEVLLWQALRRGAEGLRFRRQHPSGAYSLDFYCIEARLAVEVDGAAHAHGDRPQRDTRRDAWFEAKGIRTMRVPAEAILRDLDAVLRGILQEARSRLPLHHPALRGGPPPRAELREE